MEISKCRCSQEEALSSTNSITGKHYGAMVTNWNIHRKHTFKICCYNMDKYTYALLTSQGQEGEINWLTLVRLPFYLVSLFP